MKRQTVILLALASLMVPLLLMEVHIAYSSDQVNSSQSISKAMSGGTVGDTLTVYLTGDEALAGALRRQLPIAMKDKGLPFEEILFIDEIVDDARDNPFLVIRLDRDGGVWTPLWAARKVEATLLFTRGMLVNRDKVLASDPNRVATVFSPETCSGECVQGHRDLQLSTVHRGLVSWPFVRSFAAAKVAEQAAILVAEGLPEHLNPEKWQQRAGELVKAGLPVLEGQGYFWTFYPVEGCRGGAVIAGTVGPEGSQSDWGVMYYDASQDAVTHTIMPRDVLDRVPEVRFYSSPGFGQSDDALSIALGPGHFITIPAGTCGFSGWEISTY